MEAVSIFANVIIVGGSLAELVAGPITALSLSVPLGVYDMGNVRPLTRNELFHVIAHGVERKHLLALPGPQLHLFTGIVYDLMNRSQFISNRIFQGIVGWKSLVASAHERWAQLIQGRKQ